MDLLGYITAFSLSFQSNRTILSSAFNGIEACMTGVEALRGRAKHAGFLEEFFANDSLRAFVPSFQEIELKHTQGVDFGNLSMEDMSLSFRNAVSRAVDLVVNGMRDRYASLLDHGNGGDPCAASAMRNLTMVFNHDVWPENELDLVDYGDDEIQNLINWFSVLCCISCCRICG